MAEQPAVPPAPDTPEAFVTDAEALLRRLGANEACFAQLAARLRRLAAEPSLMDRADLAELHGSAGATILCEGSDGTALMLARFPHEQPTPVHNHNSWGVLCVVRGSDRYLRWERTDEGADPARARLRLAEERTLRAGDVLWFKEPPHDIHSQQGIDAPAWELVYFGRNPNTRPRAYFDPEAGTVTYADAAG
jgi:predicted metal-dependent enzyme (double-stranded beta helix superfamily)